MTSRTPNLRLRSLLDETGWTGPEFARAVNEEGRRSAVPTRYDRTAVAHWLGGARPREPIRELICRVLSRQLRRPVRPVDIGMGTPAAPGPATATLPEQLHRLARPGASGHRALRQLPYSPEPSLPELGRAGLPPADRSERIGSDHVRGAELMVTLFAEADEVFGGARARPALAAHLASDVAVRLRCPGSATVSRAYRRASADLAYLAGFMAFDEQLHGAAQAYLRIAAQLSAEARDPVRYATAVRQMSVQAHGLGDRRLALLLAEAAGREVRSLPARPAAAVVGQLALALAGAGRRRSALATLGRAEHLLERAEGRGTALGGYHPAAFAHQQAEVLAAVGDLTAACAALTTSLRLRPARERRARMLTTARLADLYLTRGRLELACTTWDLFLDDYPLVSSGRGDAFFRDLRRRLRSYRREPIAQRLLVRAGQVTGPSGPRRAGIPHPPGPRDGPPAGQPQ
ncbi:hypothetical protein ACIRBX_22750 [Kitasatospora sp. NPDC096147]|uniref:hypothetical protein n=1 Tax=Kitasatospora sp. NPDC096147 TaxID=3364093 RepID=UPI00382C46CE